MILLKLNYRYLNSLFFKNIVTQSDWSYSVRLKKCFKKSILKYTYYIVLKIKNQEPNMGLIIYQMFEF